MKTMSTMASPYRRFAAWLMLLSVVTRVLIPQGWMPSTHGGTSGLTMVLCSVHGKMLMNLGLADDPQGEHPDKGSAPEHPPCAFLALGNLAPPADSFVVALPPSVALRGPLYQLVEPPHVRAIRPAEARAPPVAAI